MCLHNLRTDFLGATVSSGGSWTYVGYNATSFQGPFTTNAAVPPAALAGVVPIALGGDNPAVDWASADDGYYSFNYDLGSCGGEADLVVRVNDSCFNTAVTINVHDQQGDINLNDAVVSGLSCKQSPGFWRFVSGDITLFNPVNGKFTANQATSGSTHVFEYVTAPDCTDCISTVTVNVFDCGSNDLCHYYTDFSETMDQDDMDRSEIVYFNVGGVNQISSPVVGFGIKNVITFGAAPYLTNLVDTLNNLNITCFKFYYSTVTVGAETRQKFMRICSPQGIDWEIKVKAGSLSPTYWIYNSSTGVSFSYDDVVYTTLSLTPVYNIPAATTTGIEACIVVSSCE